MVVALGQKMSTLFCAIEIRSSVNGQSETQVLIEIISANRRASVSDALFVIPQ